MCYHAGTPASVLWVLRRLRRSDGEWIQESKVRAVESSSSPFGMVDDTRERVIGLLLGLAAGDRIGGPVRMALLVAESLLDRCCSRR